MDSSLSLLSSSSLPHHWKHHVFPSFHGPDVRKTFLSHVLKEFNSKGINTFVDNDMERSKTIGHELKEAIRGSRIAIVLLSKNYASSTWCLNELVEIMECREELGQTVMSVFYEVDPTDIKKQTGDFGKVFKTACIGKTEEDIRRWKHALTEVAQIASYHSKNWKNDTEMIEDIASDVSNKLNNSAPSSDFNYLVGMESRIRKMEPLLRLDSDEVRTIGILGQSGIGKTTIARYLFNQLSPDFQLSVFMDNIKTKYVSPTCSDDYNRKLDLHKQFMSQLINEVGIKIPHLGIAKHRCKDKKVLVVLDDVNRSEQMEAMAKETWFGPGSRVIITTQDQKILISGGIEHIYKVDLPSDDEALQMFCMYAFDQKLPKDGFKELASEVTRLVGKLPLGLRVMGSHFRGMCEEDWTKELPSLKTHLDRDGEIMSILKFSYDALCDVDKLLFLYIACFFIDEEVDIVEGCLASCFSVVTRGLRVLAEKSLIDVDGGIIKMQELLVQLGKKIMREQSEPGKRQFLNDAIDIHDVFNDDKLDSSSVLGINGPDVDGGIIKMQELLVQLGKIIMREQFEPGKRQFLNDAIDIHDVFNDDKLDSSSVLGINDIDGNITCTSERAFDRLSNLWFKKKERLSNLQFLKVSSYGVNSRSLNSISGKLRFLSWEYFGMPRFPSSCNPESLVKLVMRHSKLKKLWKKTQPLSNLKWMNLSSSERLKKLPDLSSATNLYHLDLSSCSSLVKLPSSIGKAINLRKLDLSYCERLMEVPSSITTITNLKSVTLDECSRLVELPFNIERVMDPEFIDLSGCSSLVKLPFSIENAINLHELDLSLCSSLVKLSFSIENAINLSGCSSLVKLPFSTEYAINLHKLNLSGCSSLVKLSFSIENAINLHKLDLSGCSSLVKLPSFIGNAINLRELDLSHWSSLVELPSFMRNLRRLSRLELKGCSKLEVLLDNINLESLWNLDLSGCSLLKSYPESSTNIQDLIKQSGTTITKAPSSEDSWPLISTSEMCEIQELGPWIGRTSSGLDTLILRGMKNMVSLPQLPYSVRELEAYNCESLERLDCSFLNPCIRLLNFGNCFKLNQEARDLIIQTPTNGYAVLPGGEVPQCFTYRSSGGTLTVKLNQSTSTKFKACIICVDEVKREVELGQHIRVSCTITYKEKALTCIKYIKRVFPGNMYIFKVEAEEVTSTELVFEFEIYSSSATGFDVRLETCEIKECGIFQIPEVPSTELVFESDINVEPETSDFEVDSQIKERRILQFLEDEDYESFRGGGEDYEPSDTEI